jgi:rubrerythrin
MAGFLGLLGFVLWVILVVVFFKMYARLKDILYVLRQIATKQGVPEGKVGVAYCPKCKTNVNISDSKPGKCPFCGGAITG